MFLWLLALLGCCCGCCGVCVCEWSERREGRNEDPCSHQGFGAELALAPLGCW